MNAVEIRKILTRLCSQIESQSHGMSEPPRNTSVSKKPRLEDTPLEAVPLPVTSSIQAKLLSYWISRKEDKFWDVYLVFDDGAQLLCSRRDLCLMSEYFGKMFEGEFAESAERKVPIKEVESSVMDKLVHSFYSGKVMLSEGTVRTVAVAADMFLFPHVSEACRQFLAGKLTPANAVKTLKMAEEVLSLSPLRARVIEYIRQDTVEWLSTHPYHGTEHFLSDVSLSTMTDIMRDLKLKHERHKVYLINDWRRHQGSCGMELRNSSTPDCLLDTIDFSRLKPADVQKVLEIPDYSVLDDKELTKRILKHSLAQWSALDSEQANNTGKRRR